MKKTTLVLITLLLTTSLLHGQKRGRDNSTFYPTRPFYIGTTAPATCAVGDTFFDSDATAGQNLYGCTATNTWTLQGAAGTFGETSLAGLVNNQTLWDGANASRTLTFSLSGATDPVFTFANNSVSLNTPFIASSIALGTNPGSAGAVRVPNNTAITFRNAANSADLSIKLNASDEFEVDAPINITSTPAAQLFTGVTSPSAPAGAEQWYFYADSVDNLPKYIYNGGSEQTFYTTANPQASVAILTTARAIYGNNFDGSAALTQVIASTYGGTGNGFTKFSGPSSAEKTFTLPNADATITYTVASGTKALDTDLIATTACDTLATTTATGVASTDTILITPNADITGVTGYTAATTGGLQIFFWPTTNTINWKVCNPTSASITPGAVTLNYRVVR